MPESLWNRCLRVLEGELPEQQFNTWVRPLQAVERDGELKLLAPNERTIEVGTRESTAGGELRCFLDGNAIVVGLFKDGTLQGRALRYLPADPELLREGASIPENVFGCAVREYINSAWHDGDPIDTLWTVHGLRSAGGKEATASARE